MKRLLLLFASLMLGCGFPPTQSSLAAQEAGKPQAPVTEPSGQAAAGRPQIFEVAVPITPNPWNWGVSPNGRMVAYVAPVGNTTAAQPPRGARAPIAGLWVRSIDRADDRMLPGTEDAKTEAAPPFWSPDSRFIAFPAHDGNILQLKVVPAAGDLPPQVIATLGPRGTTMRRGVWGQDGAIVFANDVVRRVSEMGAPVTTLTTLDSSRRETSHSSPWILPDGKHFIYKTWSDLPANRSIFVGSLNSPERTPLVLDANSRAIFSDGFLLFTKIGTLFARPFDPERLQFTGDAVVIAEGLLYDQNLGITAFDVTTEGTLVYRMGTSGRGNGQATTAASPNLTVVRNWVSRVKKQ